MLPRTLQHDGHIPHTAAPTEDNNTARTAALQALQLQTGSNGEEQQWNYVSHCHSKKYQSTNDYLH
jgi:hypothetical protein